MDPARPSLGALTRPLLAKRITPAFQMAGSLLESQWTDCMRRGDYAAAWMISDAVLRNRDPATCDDHRQPYHLRWIWDGQPCDGKHVLVRCYHGLGDTLQFARFLPRLAARAVTLTVEAQPAVLPLLAQLVPQATLIGFDEAHPLPSRQCTIEIMELQHALRLPPEAAPPPYLHAAPDCSGGIGLCWQAGGWDPERSLPLADLVPTLRHQTPCCLQTSPPPRDLPWRNPNGCPPDLAATASLVANLDLVITVDTMMAHLAGALNRPTWLLLKHDADWRWMRHRADSPWYPSMRLFRQPTPGDWTSVIREVADALDRLDAQVDQGSPAGS